MAGVILCPLTLFVMTFAMSRGVPVAGLLFAVTMMTGIAVTLSTVAVLPILFRERLVHIFESRACSLLSHGIEGAAGIVLASVAADRSSLRDGLTAVAQGRAQLQLSSGGLMWRKAQSKAKS
ncbi:hypothetical protein P9228_11255 [Mesorhizobium sp. WSM4898]|uniref:hypothetical protein n=1 Tax=Mesorhizobium sp. WSM4898 TaxID=3038544 RepID=UPI002414D9DD|nr:hypothetical protein [Mesorhizobium sp. WSM4898]MDG4907009.1 hypothetical protein [Mesorhizobium sp. WSM4898]